MVFQYYGLGCFRLSLPNLNILIDPFSSASGLNAPRGQADVIVLSYPSFNTDKYPAKQTLRYPGEYDIADCSFVGLPAKQSDDKTLTVFYIEAGGLSTLILGGLKKFSVDTDQLSELGNIDVCIIPVGGGDVMDADEAAAAVRLLEAKIVIPAYFYLPGLKTKLDDPDKFFKEMSQKPETVDKLKITAKDLPAEGTTVVHLIPG